MSLEPGSEVADRYVVEASLGAGGMGEVLRARDRRLDRVVALKVLPAARVGDSVATERLIREARAAAALEHPNIVPVYDVGATGDGGAYLAMQLVAGTSLRARLQSEGALAVPEVRRIVGEIGAALAFAHDAGVVHRDVKPDNVMLREDGTAVVLDFGLAKRVAKGDAATLTADGTMVGTPAYLAPEQARGEALDGRADQFALGVVTYELLTGAPPWAHESVAAMIAAVLTEEAPSLGGRGLPPGVAEAVARALAKAPEDRFEDVRAFVAALGDERADLGSAATVEAPAAPPAPPAPAPDRALPTGALGALGVALLIAGGAAVWLRPSRAPAPEEAPAPDAGAPGPVTMLGGPAPEGCSADALAAYDEAIRVLHAGNWAVGCVRMRESAEADRRCASAQLRRLQCGYSDGDDAEARDAFRRAQLYSEHLTEAERALLDAFAPLIAQSPPDREEFLRRQARFAERFPDHAEMLHYAALMSSGSVEDRLRWGARATEIDPAYSDAHQAQARLLLTLGREDEALAQLRTCRERAPGATDCVGDEITVLMGRGECREALALIPTFRARGGDEDWADTFDAMLRASSGEPDDAILPRATAPDDVDAVMRAQIAALRGRLDEVVAIATSARAGSGRLTYARRVLASLEAEALLERGEAAAAAERAAALAASRERGLASVRVVADEAYRDVRALELASPALEATQAATLRERLREAITRLERVRPVERWCLLEASQATDEASARRALEAVDAPPARGSTPSLAFTGRVLALAGRHAEAAERYRRVTASCWQLLFPFLTTRAHLALGDSLEATGDRDAACAAWREVRARWGSAAPESATVRAAGERLRDCN